MNKQTLFLVINLLLSATIGHAGTISTFYGTATITVPADLPSVDLALQLDLDGAAVLHDTSYIILEKTMLFPVIPPLVDSKEVGPRLEGTVGPDTFQVRTASFTDQAGDKTVTRQIFFNNAVVGNQGNSITGEYRETVTGLLPEPFFITGEFILMRPVSSLSDPVMDSDNSGCLDLDEIRAAGMDRNLMEYNDAAAALSIRNNGGAVPVCEPADTVVRDALQEFYQNQE